MSSVFSPFLDFSASLGRCTGGGIFVQHSQFRQLQCYGSLCPACPPRALPLFGRSPLSAWELENLPVMLNDLPCQRTDPDFQELEKDCADLLRKSKISLRHLIVCRNDTIDIATEVYKLCADFPWQQVEQKSNFDLTERDEELQKITELLEQVRADNAKAIAEMQTMLQQARNENRRLQDRISAMERPKSSGPCTIL